ncbi:MAG: signal peptidase II [Vicinamibacteria bacterium]
MVLATIACDRVTKRAAAEHLAGRPAVSLARGAIRLAYAENRGGFLSIGAALPPDVRVAVFEVGPAGLLAGLGIWVFRRALGGGWIVGPALLWAGGVANVADRLSRGRVVDFMNVGVGGLRTGIFNVADVAITLGVVLVALELREHGPARGPDPRRER